MMTFNYSDLHLYGKVKLQQFAELSQIEGYEDMSCEMLREALEEEGQRLASEGDKAFLELID